MARNQPLLVNVYDSRAVARAIAAQLATKTEEINATMKTVNKHRIDLLEVCCPEDSPLSTAVMDQG